MRSRVQRCQIRSAVVKVDAFYHSLVLSSKAGSLNLFKDGMPFEINEDKASFILEEEDLFITVDLNMGTKESKMYTCDFSHEYVSINADYRS